MKVLAVLLILISYLMELLYLQSADVLIGHNIIGYDIPAIEKILDVKLNTKVIDTLVHV